MDGGIAILRDPNKQGKENQDSMPNMTGRPGYRKMEMIVPRSYPCVPLFSTLFNKGWKQKSVLDYQGQAGIISIVRWNLRPVIFGVEGLSFFGDRPFGSNMHVQMVFHSALTQAVLDGVPPTGLQLLRSERVLSE